MLLVVVVLVAAATLWWLLHRLGGSSRSLTRLGVFRRPFPGLAVAIVVAGLLAAPGPAAVATPLSSELRPPNGFKPLSTSVVSNTQSWVYGSAPCASGQTCATLLHSTDAGRSYQRRPYPVTASGCAKAPCRPYVQQVTFNDAQHGVAYEGTGTYVTDTGGAHWTRASAKVDLYEVLPEPGFFLGVGFHPNTTDSGDLTAYRIDFDGSIHPLTHFAGVRSNLFDGLVGTRRGALLLSLDARGTTARVSTNGGTSWHTTTSIPCPTGTIAQQLSGSPAALWLDCAPNEPVNTPGYVDQLLISIDGGLHWSQPHPIPRGDNPYNGTIGLVPFTGQIGLAVISQTQAARTADGGRTWAVVLHTPNGLLTTGQASDATHGSLSVIGYPARQPSSSYWTSDSGQHFTKRLYSY